jgi:hypothetical protein
MTWSSTECIDRVRGDLLGLDIPAHEAALRAGGAAFLTEAFRAAGALAGDNRVARITGLEECPGGSTGRKLFLSVAYDQSTPGLHAELFVKFSRDFDDSIRDQGKNQLEPEVRLALLSREPGFPITVPDCYFADYHAETGTGILITRRIPFGSNGLEPLYEKCLDYDIPEPLAHYRAIIKSLARLAGSQKSGRLPDSVARYFPFDADNQAISPPIRYDLEQLLRRVSKLQSFAAAHPQLLPPEIAADDFIAQLQRDIPRFLEHECAIKQALHSRQDYIALIHWNANVDNAWFWRTAQGELECGLMDWGSVSQMNIGMALWGALSAAETSLWNEHLDELLGLFISEFQRAGGPELAPQELKLQMFMAIAIMSLSWLMDAPAMIRRELPDLARTATRYDPAFRRNETARVQLQMFTNFLNLWQREGFGQRLVDFQRR